MLPGDSPLTFALLAEYLAGVGKKVESSSLENWGTGVSLDGLGFDAGRHEFVVKGNGFGRDLFELRAQDLPKLYRGSAIDCRISDERRANKNAGKL